MSELEIGIDVGLDIAMMVVPTSNVQSKGLNIWPKQ